MNKKEAACITKDFAQSHHNPPEKKKILPRKKKQKTPTPCLQKNLFLDSPPPSHSLPYTENGVPSLRSATRSSTFVNHSPSSFCFSAVVLMCCERAYDDPDELVELPRLLPSRLGVDGFDGAVVVSGIR